MRFGCSSKSTFLNRDILRPSRFAKVIVAVLLLSASAPPVRAQTPFDELKERIERLEQENQDLKASVRAQTIPVRPVETIPPAPDVELFADPNDFSERTRGDSEEETRLNGLIEKYLNRRSGEPARENDAFSDKISLVESKIAGVLERLNKKTYPTVQVYGTMQADTGYFFQDANSLVSYGHIANGADFRRARLGARGAINDRVNYVFQMDFAFFGRPTFTDVYVEQTDIPYLGNVRIGQWKQPFSLEVVSSYRYTTFMERSVLFQPFTAFRHLGIGFYDHADDLTMTWAGSVFAAGQDQFGNSLFENQTASGEFTNINMGGVGTAERLTWVPYWDECTNGVDYLHLGFGHYFSAPPGHTIGFRTIPELFIGQAANVINGGSSFQPTPGGANGTPFFVNTGNQSVNFYNVLGTELLWVNGPLSLQSEAMVNFVYQSGTTATLPGMYAQVGYFLTGEHRPYDRKLGQIDRIMPFRNFSFNKDGCNTGIGAWEVAGRFSYLNLNDKSLQGGTIADYTAGVNWYLNPYVKLVFNYIHSSTSYAGIGGAPPIAGAISRRNQTDMIAARCQMEF